MIQGSLLEEMVVTGYAIREKSQLYGLVGANANYDYFNSNNTEQYGLIKENTFKDPNFEALSTFSIDVDGASYSNSRRFLNMGRKPPKDAVRVEEFINYFGYNYPEPSSDKPLAIHTTYTECPWDSDHRLLHIAMQAQKIKTENLPSSNLVFLIDVSGSMSNMNKLPLVKSSLNLLVNQMGQEDRISIVTYAGSAGIVLQSTSGANKDKIKTAIASLAAGGSTAGAQGIRTAYNLAKANYLPDGNNRVILATDGDFNVGIYSPDELERLIETKRESNIFLSVLGYGMGNYKDEQMQSLANKGNGIHAYIDSYQEAKKLFVEEFFGTIYTLAKDVKLQIEFNPQHIQSYRLIGYENRLLEREDFNDDKIDAGEIGSGHSVTAIYELIPHGVENKFVEKVDKLKYQSKTNMAFITESSDELVTIKFRYKEPRDESSKKITEVTYVNDYMAFANADTDVKFSIATAAFGMKLRDSEFIDEYSYNDIVELAQKCKNEDPYGYRSEFIRLVESANSM